MNAFLGIILVFSLYMLWQTSLNYIQEDAMCTVTKLTYKRRTKSEWGDSYTVYLVVTFPPDPTIHKRKMTINHNGLSNQTIHNMIAYYQPGVGKATRCKLRPLISSISALKNARPDTCEPELALTIVATILCGLTIIGIVSYTAWQAMRCRRVEYMDPCSEELGGAIIDETD